MRNTAWMYVLMIVLAVGLGACDSGSSAGGSSGHDSGSPGADTSGAEDTAPAEDTVAAEDTAPGDVAAPEDMVAPEDIALNEDAELIEDVDLLEDIDLLADIDLIEDIDLTTDTLTPEDTTPPGFSLTSPAFEDQGTMAAPHVCVDYEDLGVSPPLEWVGAPAETTYLGLTCVDVSAGGFVHWVIWDIPAAAGGLPEGLLTEMLVPEGMQGMNDFGTIGWGGPCPPPNGPHEYVFTLWALDGLLAVDPETAAFADVVAAFEEHVVGETATLTGFYEAP